uniref:SFRICE_024502 n=1 Tax=Spodoptera frugiperda TaxID=7108 RepID=A0A2H1V522_SPOFR
MSLGRAGLQYSGVFMFVSTVDPGLQELQRPASYVSHATDFWLSCIETHTTASSDPHRTDRIIGNAYMRCVPMPSYAVPMPKIRVKVVSAIRLLILAPAIR